MNLSLQDLQAEAAATGFSLEPLDKVIRLVDLLNAFCRHPFIEDRMVLKGGTALNLFVFDLPGLSVDNEQGEIAPDLLTGDDELAARIRQHPQLLWKAKHVREHGGLSLG